MMDPYQQVGRDAQPINQLPHEHLTDGGSTLLDEKAEHGAVYCLLRIHEVSIESP